jgi:hypothetical protein
MSGDTNETVVVKQGSKVPPNLCSVQPAVYVINVAAQKNKHAGVCRMKAPAC